MGRLALIALAGAAGALCRLGGFTTFSTFALEALTLEATDRLGLAVVYAACSVALGFGAAALGQFVGRSMP